MILFASDLDNTLIFSYKKVTKEAICVEYLDEKPLSYMTTWAYSTLQNIEKQTIFVPITTRSLKQYNRIRLLEDKVPNYALVSNGGILLVDGEIDNTWYEESKRQIALTLPELYKAMEILKTDQNVTLEPRFVDDLFVFTKTSDTNATVKLLSETLDLAKVTIDLNEQKLYVLPKMLNKGVALERLKKKIESDLVISSGDSYFDVPMLMTADISIIPKENKIQEFLSSHPNIIVAKEEGMGFSDEILRIVTLYIEENNMKMA